RGVIAYRRTRTPEQVQADIRAGLAECLRSGTTLLGDIAAEGASWDAVAGEKIRAVVFKEWIGFSEGDRRVKEDIGWWNARGVSTLNCRAGWSPHAPYSVASWAMLLVGSQALTTVHWAESPAEMEFIEKHSGPFVAFLKELGLWAGAESELIPSHKQIHAQLGRRSTHLLLAHANYQPVDA